MRSQYPQYGQGQDWERERYRNESEQQRGQGGDFGMQRQRYFEDYPSQQYQQSQRSIEHPGMEYYGSGGGYGGGMGESTSQPGGYGGREAGGFRQQEAFHPGGGQYGGYGEGSGGYGREESGHRTFGGAYGPEAREMERRYGLYGYHEQFAQHQGYNQGAYGQQGFGHQGYGQQQGFGQQQSGYGQGMQGRSMRRGPKDYTRSDERLREAVCERLVEDHSVDVSEVSVDVKDGRVILEGSVPERRMRYRIEDIADSCWGVKDVENRVRVEMGQYGMKSSDLSLTSGSPTSNNPSAVAARQGAGGTGLETSASAPSATGSSPTTGSSPAGSETKGRS